MPGKYFLHLIRNGSRVVFTGKCACACLWVHYWLHMYACMCIDIFLYMCPSGFAMGGALAGAVVSGMLDDSYMNKEVLESRVACITFGHPLIADHTLQELVERGGLPATCLHHIHLQEDSIPVLLRYAFVQQEAAVKPDGETGAAVCILTMLNTNLYYHAVCKTTTTPSVLCGYISCTK